MSSDDEWNPEFEHIDWNDIVEAEQSGDAETLQELRDKSMELKRSFSCPSPSPSTPMNCSPVQSNFKVPREQPSRKRPNLSNQRPFMDWDDIKQDEYPALPRRNTHPTLNSATPPSTVSYAQALQPRLTKRTISERHCLSPIDCQPKRSALTKMISTPKENGEGSIRSVNDISTPQGMTTSTVNDEQMEYTTPDTDSRPSKAATAVQRRLFPSAKENNSPKSTTDTKSLSDKQLAQREKQITYGKNTLGYQRYVQTLPKWQRQRGDPMTPDKFKCCSTRAWQGQIKVWRRALHKYDPPNEQGLSQFTTEQAQLCDLEIPGSLWGTLL